MEDVNNMKRKRKFRPILVRPIPVSHLPFARIHDDNLGTRGDLGFALQ